MDDIGRAITNEIVERLRTVHGIVLKGESLKRCEDVAEIRVVKYVRTGLTEGKNYWEIPRFHDFILKTVLDEIAKEIKKQAPNPNPDQLESLATAVMKRDPTKAGCLRMLHDVNPEKGAILTPVCGF